jgi:hypothetical protein
MGEAGAGLLARGGGAAHARQKTKADAMKIMDVTSLEKSIQPLKEYFNHNQDQYRFLAVLSPT